MPTTERAADQEASGLVDERYVVGVDYGTLSGRAVVVRVSDGAELGSAAFAYPHAVMDRILARSGVTLPPDWALQVPSDYVDVLKHAVPDAIAAAGIDPANVVGIGTDFTACTMIPTLSDGTPLNELPEFADRPHAYVKLWKHHAAQPQADRINELAAVRGESWSPRYGGLISSEWEFAKGLQLLEEDPEIYDRMQHWVEAADWIVWQLTGTYVRNACTAGYKGMLQDGEYPSRDFLKALNPGFETFAETKVAHQIGQLGASAGRLSAEAAALTGLPEGIAVAVGNVDAHVTAPAARAVKPGQMVAIMGTSTCHVMNSDRLVEVPGMCGVVDGGIVDGLYGYEAGQSGVGDIFAWFVENQVPARYSTEAAAAGLSVHQYLTELIAGQPVGGHGLVALDWASGNRSVLVDHELSGLVLGTTLTTRTEEIYRALLESTAFGTRKIVETFTAAGVPVTEFIVAGGLLKNAFLMQVYSDVLRMPISTIASDQGPALGSAIHAAVAAGVYPNVLAAGEAMGKVNTNVYQPNDEAADAYDRLYAEYSLLHDYFGRGANDVMHRLAALRREGFAAASAGAASVGAGGTDLDSLEQQSLEPEPEHKPEHSAGATAQSMEAAK
ncbi:ribulokinase [Subtercola lobariae]|uniref:ribulokinase n=1 Tax=Subtercola lobariae TaxID=1588641 RepID=UPI001E4F02AD|nr:ribulokinase [Subtercola lobariae]